MSAATLVVTATPNPAEMASLQAYLQGVMPLLIGAGGKLIKRLQVSQVVHGNPSGMAMVMDFESQEAIAGIFETEEYKALVPARDKGFKEMNILITQELQIPS